LLPKGDTTPSLQRELCACGVAEKDIAELHCQRRRKTEAGAIPEMQNLEGKSS